MPGLFPAIAEGFDGGEEFADWLAVWAARATRDQRSSAAVLKTREARRKSGPQRARESLGLTPRQLIAAGILKAPLALVYKYKGRQR